MNAPEPAAPIAAAAQHQYLALATIARSKLNPRKHFDDNAHNELTASVRKPGVIQPILVRPASSERDKRVLYEIVAGERRYRAAVAAGLEDIPAIVRDLTDVEALELAVVENLQRSDLHPLEEAEGYEALMSKHEYTVERLADKVGKSIGYIYARLKLLALTPEGRDAFYSGALNSSTAILVARIPSQKLQRQAVKELTELDYRGDPMPVRQAAEHIQRTYMTELKHAPFKTDDATLLPKAGACTQCQKRSGAQPELFADVKSADVCTDTECFGKKREAQWARAREAAAATGRKVITGKEAKALKGSQYSSIGGGYRLLESIVPDDEKRRTVAQILGKAAAAQADLLEDPYTHELVPVIKESALAEALKAKGITAPKSPAPRKLSEAEKFADEIRLAILAEIRAAPASAMTIADFVEMALVLCVDCDDDLLKRWECPESERYGPERMEDLRKWLGTLESVQLTRFMLEATLCNFSAGDDVLRAAAARRNIDVKAITARVIAEQKAARAADNNADESKPAKKGAKKRA